VLGTGGAAPGEGLVTDLTDALHAARDPGTRFVVLPGILVRFGLRVDLATDPAWERADVETAVRDALTAHTSAPVLRFTAPVTASQVLVTVTSVPGVVACSVPGLAPVTSPLGAPVVLHPDGLDVLATLPARWLDGSVVAAQTATLVADAVQIGVMRP
jgi:hypothetical protein